jgi:hypothetical protein
MSEDEVLIELDDRKRASLGRLAEPGQRYRVTREPDSTLIWEPVVVMSEAEVRLLANPELVEQIEDNRAHPERLRPRRRE